MDLPDAQEAEPRVRAVAEARGAPFFAISAVTGRGVDALLRALFREVAAARARAAAQDARG
jgi:GTP-binding protein